MHFIALIIHLVLSLHLITNLSQKGRVFLDIHFFRLVVLTFSFCVITVIDISVVYILLDRICVFAMSRRIILSNAWFKSWNISTCINETSNSLRTLIAMNMSYWTTAFRLIRGYLRYGSLWNVFFWIIEWGG